MKSKYKIISIFTIISFVLIVILGFFVKVNITGSAVLQFVEYDQYFTLKKSTNIKLEINKLIYVDYKNQKVNCKITNIFSNEIYWTFQINKFLFFDNEILMKDINITFENTYLFSYLFSYII